MTDFDALLNAAVEERTSEPNSEVVEILVGKTLLTLKFTEVETLKWAHLTSSHPRRLDVALDLKYGYNVHEVSEAAARISGVVVEDGEESELTPDQWDKLFIAIETPSRGLITDAIWLLNEFAPGERLAKAKKDSRAERKRKPSSPAN